MRQTKGSHPVVHLGTETLTEEPVTLTVDGAIIVISGESRDDRQLLAKTITSRRQLLLPIRFLYLETPLSQSKDLKATLENPQHQLIIVLEDIAELDPDPGSELLKTAHIFAFRQDTNRASRIAPHMNLTPYEQRLLTSIQPGTCIHTGPHRPRPVIMKVQPQG